ncbi:cation:proton antiporter domain-containing protein [Clostridium sp.]|uniref:cation:proton antiporter domain-containing protein n=1 Tax=Clostridium sp. TaxID=1506 RepID=UPI003F3CB64F
MDILALVVIAPILFIVGQFISKKTKIAPPIFYLAMGILFGGSAGIVHIFGNQDLLPNMANYNTIALWLMFFGAGFNIDLNKLKTSGKDTITLSSLPVFIEGIIMTVIVTIGVKVLPLGFDLGFWQVMIIMMLFAMASPANIIPACVGYNMKGYAGKNRITDSLITASIFDNFIPFPLLVVALILTVAPAMGMELSPIMITGIVFAVVVGLVIVCVISGVLGGIAAKALSPLSDKVHQNPDNKKLKIAYTMIYFIIFAFLLNLSGPLKSLAVLIIVAISVGINQKEKNKLGSVIGLNSSIIFAMFGSPIIFTYVGSLINIRALLNPVMLIFGITVTFIAILIKGFVTKRIVLKDNRYTEGERIFAAASFVPKGIILVNFSLILMGPLNAVGLGYIIDFMILMAAISIVASVPLGITLLDKAGDKWLFKEDYNEDSVSEYV